MPQEMSMRDRYLHEQKQKSFKQTQNNQDQYGDQSGYSDNATYAPSQKSSKSSQIQWGSGSGNREQEEERSYSNYQPKQPEDNSWQKNKKTTKAYYENNQFNTKDAPFG